MLARLCSPFLYIWRRLIIFGEIKEVSIENLYYIIHIYMIFILLKKLLDYSRSLFLYYGQDMKNYSGAFNFIFSSNPDGSPFLACSMILSKYSLVASSHLSSDIYGIIFAFSSSFNAFSALAGSVL